jgi:hypothetical protein
VIEMWEQNVEDGLRGLPAGVFDLRNGLLDASGAE